MCKWRGRSDLTAGTPDLFTAVPVHDAPLHAAGILPQILEQEGPVHHAVDAHTPERLVVQLVALEADQLGHAKAERALEDARIADEDERFADRQGSDGVEIGARESVALPNVNGSMKLRHLGVARQFQLAQERVARADELHTGRVDIDDP